MTQGIVDWSAGVPQGWATWAPGSGPVVADELAARLADGDPARARVREAVLTIDALPREGVYLSYGVWAPDRATGEPFGDLVAELLVGTPGTPLSAAQYLESVRRPPKVKGVKVFHHDASATDVDAGPAVIVTTSSAQRRSGQVVTAVHWTVFPPDAHEAVRLSFSTPLAAVAEALAAQSIEIVNRVAVTLGDPS